MLLPKPCQDHDFFNSRTRLDCSPEAHLEGACQQILLLEYGTYLVYSFKLIQMSQDGNSSDVQGGTSTIILHPILKLQFRFLIPAVTMPVLLFRHIPIRLAFTVRSSISEGCEETSVLLAISVVASVTSSPFLFFVAYLCLIISSLRYGTVASLSQHIFNWFRNLTAIITPITGTILIMINRLNGNQEIAEQVDEENIIEAETNRIQNLRPSSTDDDENNLEVVVIT
ncbi:hypothetical protein WN944_026093 [Citrus x changshan-huyou]|uniref:Uncharacterized protein n=1 Tax=Citrus x changshan-huyou TaxID=2935761 RepID=A0AAP0QE83_9ROSI